MIGARPVPLSRVLDLVAETAPPPLAESWDRVGLMVGAPDWPVRRALVGLELTADLLDRAGRLGADLILVHHPPLFRPLTALDPSRPEAALALRAYDERRGVIAAHTNLDAARGGVNDALADLLGLTGTRALRPASGSAWRKLAVFVPVGYEDRVFEAVVAAGAGRIGDYTGCSWRSRGEGTFRPGEMSHPFLGQGSLPQRAAEVRLEVLVPAHRLGPVTAALIAAHPYEEPAFDLYPLEQTGGPEGAGRVGDLSPEAALDDFVDVVKDRLGAPVIQVANARASAIGRVAVCGGSGGDLIANALAAGADVFVTGEAGHHAARDLEGTDLGLLVVGHFYSERPVVPVWTKHLAAGAGRRGWSLEFVGDDDQSPAFAFR
jgi:dinuclear metal center YbgI/SA1388 family protein